MNVSNNRPAMHLTYEITIPVLNEEHRLRKGIETLCRFLADNGLSDCRIVIADNGSTDATASVAGELTKSFPNTTYISLGRKGVGLALKASWDRSSADVVGYMDVDLATDLEHFKEVVSVMQLGRADIVNGSRNLPASEVSNRKLIRNISSKAFNAILRLALGVRFSDGMCGFKFLKRDAYRQIAAAGVRNDGWFFCTEVLCLGERLGFSIHEIPVRWQDDRDSRVRLIKLSSYYLLEIIRLRFRKVGYKEQP